jgi:hypothetical protein
MYYNLQKNPQPNCGMNANKYYLYTLSSRTIFRAGNQAA